MQRFLETYRNRSQRFGLGNLDDFCIQYPQTKVHSMALSTLFGYYEFYENLTLGRVWFFDGLVCIQRKKKVMCILYDATQHYDFSLISQKVEILSSVNLGKLDQFKCSKTDEMLYDIDKVLNTESYATSKDRSRSLLYPMRLAEKAGFYSEEITLGNLQLAKAIHGEWMPHKLADSDVYKITFGGKKYWDLVENYVRVFNKFFAAFLRLGFANRLPFSVECDYVVGSCAFAMSSFCLYWQRELFKSNMSEGSRLLLLKELRATGVQYFNYGFSLNSNLKGYKKHWPYELVYVYRYQKEKTVDSNTFSKLISEEPA